MENMNEHESKFYMNENIKDNEAYNKWLEEFSEITYNPDFVDETIVSILIAIHKKDLVKRLYEEVFDERFYSGCDQYSVATAIALISKGCKNIEMLRGYGIIEEKYKKNIIEQTPAGEKYAQLGYVPHNYLIIKVNNKDYIFSPKYTSFSNRLVSDISANFHSELISSYMALKHQDSDNYSLIFSDCVKANINGFDFEKYPIYLKDKKGIAVLYKSYERTKFML